MAKKAPSVSILSIFPHSDGLLSQLTLPIYAWAYYKNKRVDLLTGEVFSSSLETLQDQLNQIPLNTFFSRPRIIHLFYEWGYFYSGHELLLGEESLLAIDLTFEDRFLSYQPTSFKEVKLKPLKSISYDHYYRIFRKGYDRLLRGDCYQYNLTYPFSYTFSPSLNDSSDFEDIISFYWRNRDFLGEWGIATFIGPWQKAFISNTPELLFKIVDNKDHINIISTPIKGTIPLDSSNNFNKKWEQLQACAKNCGELDMITDLIRNDLSKIEHPKSRVTALGKPLKAPGLLHRYSQIQVSVSPSISLGRVLECLFPGGSITGAPKKSSMEIIQNLEEVSRGFYCGSTLFLYKKQKTASINIRSFTLFQKILQIHAGGGITLQSHPQGEFDEMIAKRNSALAAFI